MPGIITFKPIHADLEKGTNFLGTLNPYCTLTIGQQKAKTGICKRGGASPKWDDSLILKQENQSVCHFELKARKIGIPRTIGTCEIDLEEFIKEKKKTKWVAISHNNKIVGQVLIEGAFEAEYDTSKHDLVDINLDFE